jgi:hypothetical protein
MGRLGLAFRIFFDVLFNAQKAEQVRAIEHAAPPATDSTEPAAEPATDRPAPQSGQPKPAPPRPGRSEALSLLEALQREARLIDFLQEDLSGYADQQVGAAVRDVHRGSQAVLSRMFQIVPAIEASEGSRFTVQGQESPAAVRLLGKVSDTRPLTGTVVHPGWKAERCELPQWTGTPDAQFLIAPAEIEIT